jgi:hypothetical protein
MKNYVVILISILYSLQIYSQGEIDNEKKIFYRDEKTYSVSLNSNGFGFGYRYAKRIDYTRKTTYEIQFAHIKDDKEIKLTNSTQQINRSFVYGKLNNFFALRGGIGYQKELFEKFDKGGISIRYFYNTGLSIGILKPVYYEVYQINPVTNVTEKLIIKFEKHIYPESRASFFKGIDEISFDPGLYVKGGFTFEFSKYDQVFNAIETGIILDGFIKKVPIMEVENQNHFFITLFLSYRFGKVINSQFKSRRTKIDELITE